MMPQPAGYKGRPTIALNPHAADFVAHETTATGLRTGERIAAAGYDFTIQGESRLFTLTYAVTRSSGEKHEVVVPVVLQTTHPHFGGLRWWFTCPLVVNGRPCRRRVGKLYLPPNGLYFGCRHCYDLTCRSCQESHGYDRLYALVAGRIPGATPQMIKRALNG